MFDGLDQECGVEGLLREIELLDAARVHGEVVPARGRHGAVVEIDAFELPALRTELRQEVEMEPIAAPDVDDASGCRQIAEGVQEAAGFEATPHGVHDTEPVLGECERVVVVGVDAIELRRDRPTIEIHDSTLDAPHREEAVRRRPVFEIGTGPDGFGIASSTDATGRGLGHQRTGGHGLTNSCSIAAMVRSAA